MITTLVWIVSPRAEAQDTWYTVTGPVHYRCADAFTGASLASGQGTFAFDVSWDTTAPAWRSGADGSWFVFGPSAAPGELALDVMLTSGPFVDGFSSSGAYRARATDGSVRLGDSVTFSSDDYLEPDATHPSYGYVVGLSTADDVYANGGAAMPEELFADLDVAPRKGRGYWRGEGYVCAWGIPAASTDVECTYDPDGDGVCDGPVTVVDGDGDGAFSDADCDDADADVFPGATEVTDDGVDQDCDGSDDCFVDDDDDGARTDETAVGLDLDCEDAFEGETADALDCDDADGDVFPGAVDAAGDGVDQDCDGVDPVDADGDNDGYDVGLDCDDADPAVHPGAVEAAGDNVDTNCDGVEDCFVDADNDGTRTTAVDVGGSNDDADCNDAAEAVAADPNGDCNDGDANVEPGVPEVVGNNVDDNCDAVEDCFVDADNDGARTSVVDVGGSNNDADCNDANEGRPADAIDCADSNAAAFPGATEVPNDGVDQDCDGSDLSLVVWADVQPIFAASCAGCHYGGGGLGGLTFATPADIVNVSSGDGVPVLDHIEPGSPSQSYFWHKLNNTQASIGGTGSSMPLGMGLSAAQLATIEQWILDGAL